MATHESPFSRLEVPQVQSQEAFTAVPSWVYAFSLDLQDATLPSEYATDLRRVDSVLLSQLLALLDWRPRAAGATIAALLGRAEFTHQIGKLLLRSDQCNAGRSFALALGIFRTPESLGYLYQYLDYYLTRRDLMFDQAFVYATLKDVDAQFGTRVAKRYEDAILDWVGERNFDWLRETEHFAAQSLAIARAFQHDA